MFLSKVDLFSLDPTQDSTHLIIPANIIYGWKDLPGTNNSFYLAPFLAAKNFFVTMAPGPFEIASCNSVYMLTLLNTTLFGMGLAFLRR